MNYSSSDLLGYYPVNFVLLKGKALVRLAVLSDEQFSGPFIHHRRHVADSSHLLIDLDTLADNINQFPQATIAAFVFHHARCGSTLLGKMLNQKQESRVVFEPEVVNQLLRSKAPLATKQKWLRLIVRLFAHSRSSLCLSIKFSSMCLHYLEFIRETFPNVGCIGLYRHPIETMVALAEANKVFPPASLYDQELMASHLHCTAEQVGQMTREEYIAINLAKMLAKLINLAVQPNTWLIDYKMMPNVFVDGFEQYFKRSLSDIEKQAMRVVSRYYSKNESKLVFVDDSDGKVKRMTAEISQHVAVPLSLYQQLVHLQSSS